MSTHSRSRKRGPDGRFVSDGTLVSRFWPKVDKRGPDECWPWTGKQNTQGYGRMGRVIATHAALALVGSSRPSLAHGACHTCDNPWCVNPAHLWWGTQAENTEDCIRKGRHPPSQQTHCKRGHPLSGDNLMSFAKPARICRTCEAARKRAFRSRQRIAA